MHAKGVKEVQVSIDSSSKSLVITDDGEGISLKAMEIFNKKTAAFPSSNKGSGLGLSIVKDIIEQYGGSLEIEALKPRGTRVTIFFSS
jgi:signal transduction histidine kinase